ncbi:unnamed protein product [Polarella glacialis]|uniref:Calcineurin-like phosphoesterase domain-containing protein n=1 Tax=Polarella glacialis TaxID=89957 RepID=A0A813FJF0_POLGL|nr:unnamed protein product [Polarella glacialis]
MDMEFWRCKRRCKRLVFSLLEKMTPLPSWLWEFYLGFRVSSEPPPDGAKVDYVPLPSNGLVTRLPFSELPPLRSEDVLRIVIVSDTHERHRQVMVPEGDVLLHCGDILMSSSLCRADRSLEALRDFNRWLGCQPCREKVVIGGNHDFGLEQLGPSFGSALLSEASALLQDSSVVLPVSGLKIYGNAYSEGSSHNRAWQASSQVTAEACQGSDIVMTHQLNTSMQDKLQAAGVRPRLWASGHDHDQHGVNLRGFTLFVNAAIHDDKYRPWQPPVVIDLPRKVDQPRAESRKPS